MVDFSKVKNVKFTIDEGMKMRAQIGLNIGMTIGMFGAGVCSVIFIQNIWLRIFSGLGFSCAILLQTFGCIAALQQYKSYQAAMRMFRGEPANPNDVSTNPQSDKQMKGGYIG